MGAARWWKVPDPGWAWLARAWCLPLGGGNRRRMVSGQSLAHAEQGRRQLPTATAQDRRYRRDRATSVRHRRSQPASGVMSVMGPNDHVDRADAHELLR